MRRGLVFLTSVLAVALLWGCPATPQKSDSAPSGQVELTKPSPGPIIILTPKETGTGSGIYTSTWTVADGLCAANDATEVGNLRLDGFGKVTTMRVWKKDGTFVDITGSLSLGFTVQDVDGNFHAIEVRRTAAGNFQWKSNSVSLQICDMASSECLPNCQNACGLPKDFFGTITGTPQFGGVDIAHLDHVEMRADYNNPCM